MHDLAFEKLVRYDPGKLGIGLRVELRIGRESVVVDAKIDTGALCLYF